MLEKINSSVEELSNTLAYVNMMLIEVDTEINRTTQANIHEDQKLALSLSYQQDQSNKINANGKTHAQWWNKKYANYEETADTGMVPIKKVLERMTKWKDSVSIIIPDIKNVLNYNPEGLPSLSEILEKIENDEVTGDIRFTNRIRYLISFNIPVFEKSNLPVLVLSPAPAARAEELKARVKITWFTFTVFIWLSFSFRIY
jgi:hypothetical protein